MREPEAGTDEFKVVMSRHGTRGFSPTTLRRRRGEAKLTLKELAYLAGVSAATLSAWEAGKAQPSPRKLAAVAKILRVTVGDLTAIPSNDLRLADLRYQVGLTQTDAAAALSVVVSAVSEMEVGTRPTTAAQRSILAQLYGVSPELLETVCARTTRLLRARLSGT